MGGTIGFTLREPDGIEHRMSRWTNWTPYAIDHVGMVGKSPEHIATVLHEWKKQMQLPEAERHWAYASPFLAPVEYGLVVVDLQKNKLLDLNGYHRFGSIFKINVTLQRQRDVVVERGLSEKDPAIAESLFKIWGSDAERFYQFYKQKRIKDLQYWDHEAGVKRSSGVDINALNVDELIAFLLQEERSNPHYYGDFILDMSPLEVVTFPESPEGVVSLKQAVLDLGFTLSATEEQLWTEYLEHWQEE